MAVGSSTIASWTIDKGQTAGFARFQLSFPPGVIIEPLKTDGASFTYEDQKGQVHLDGHPNDTLYPHFSATECTQ